jgi:hypothetical protein
MRNSFIASTTIATLLLLSACTNTGLSGASPSATATTTASATIALSSPSPSVSPTSTSTAAASPSPASGTASPGATATAAATGVTARDVCSLVQRADVEAVIGTLITQPAKVDLPLPGFIASACIYASNDGTLTVAMGPRTIGRTEFETVVRLAPGATAVTGVADSAFSLKADAPSGAAGAAAIVALKGTTYFTVQATHRTKTSDALLTAVTDLAKKVASSL